MKNIYRIDDNGNWGNYYKVEFPDGQIIDEDNHDFERDGFYWSKTPPKEYLEWIELNNHLE